MAYVLTYNSLTTDIQAYLERNDLNIVENIPLFIMLAERRVATDLKILTLKVAVTDQLLVGVSVIAKPTRWLNDSSFNIGTSTDFNTRIFLQQRSYEWCRTYWPDPTVTSQPKYYASDYNYNFWFIVPTPDLEYPYEAIYYETPQLIDTTTSVNVLTANVPQILLYACLLEAVLYVKDDERIAVCTKYYEEAKQALSNEDMRRIYDAYSTRGG